ncbi:unnamed protein product [Prorocentrum cordatum]|uniref:Uncharacterized protein n=1 Tax=Prorocentrum cordatum TaxID=2364126 RepID=A0ABN9YHI3_9DINO|nr:unnamed protein product [Polarella glacialis]
MVSGAVLYLQVLGVLLGWGKSGGGPRLAFGCELGAAGKPWSLGISEARAAWVTSRGDRVLQDGFVSLREREEALGWVAFARGALEYDVPFLGPLCRFVAASGDIVTVAGWEAAAPGEGGDPPSTKRARGFYMELGVANWDGRCIALCFTDSQVASRVVEKFMSTKLVLCVAAMELSAQQEARRADLVSEWAPRGLNCQADDLANGILESFDDKVRFQWRIKNMEFLVMGRMLDEAMAVKVALAKVPSSPGG